MEPDAVERRLAAILHGDVAGYSRLMADDDAATVEAIDAERRRVPERVREYRGRLVDFTGDNFLAEFPSALDAAKCALALQRELAEAGAADARRTMRFRVGLHLGDVIERDGRIYGDGVNVAARLQGLAPAGARVTPFEISLAGGADELLQPELVGHLNVHPTEGPPTR